MEFEKQVVRIYQRILQTTGCNVIAIAIQIIVGCVMVFGCVNVGVMHSNFVNKNGLL